MKKNFVNQTKERLFYEIDENVDPGADLDNTVFKLTEIFEKYT